VKALGVVATTLFALVQANMASGQNNNWPAKPIRMIVPFTPGSASDVTGRILGQRLGEMYGQQVVIDNRPGAGGLIGSELTRAAAPDGYTIAMVGQPHLSNVLMRTEKPYDPLKDFVAIGLEAITPNIIVLGKGVEVKTIPDLIALAKARPGALNYGSAGVGSSSHLAGAMFVSKAGIDVVHVPFRQGADSRSALVTGQIQFYIYPLPAIVGLVKSGQLRALAVTSRKRAAALPDVPTSAEAGFSQYVSESWFGFVGPRGLSKQIVSRLNADALSVLNEAATRRQFDSQGAEPGYGFPEDFEKLQQDEYRELGALIKAIGMNTQ
jgi:tripartite-type tricarboxylate transporter receptor subunit TctC